MTMRNVVHLKPMLAWFVLTLSAAAAFGQDGPTPTYSDIRQEVEVRPLPQDPRGRPRAPNFFQLAGAGNERLCKEVLNVFNEPGRYAGEEDGARWLLDNSRQIEFRSLRAPSAAEGAAVSVFLGLEYVNVDIDADGDDEHVYRLTSVLSSRQHQRLMIVEEQLQSRPELLGNYAKRCTQVDPSADCDSINTKIRYALSARVPDRLAEEWVFTRQSIWNWTTRDAESRRLIFVERNRAGRNVGSDTDAYWSLYQIDGTVLAVAAPILDFAPPELLVFAPEPRRAGALQCVLMPVAWHK